MGSHGSCAVAITASSIWCVTSTSEQNFENCNFLSTRMHQRCPCPITWLSVWPRKFAASWPYHNRIANFYCFLAFCEQAAYTLCILSCLWGGTQELPFEWYCDKLLERWNCQRASLNYHHSNCRMLLWLDCFRGKFAVVKRCIHRETGVEYAAKFLHKRRRGRDSRQDVLHEVDMLTITRLHPHIVDLVEVFETSHDFILITE